MLDSSFEKSEIQKDLEERLNRGPWCGALYDLSSWNYYEHATQWDGSWKTELSPPVSRFLTTGIHKEKIKKVMTEILSLAREDFAENGNKYSRTRVWLWEADLYAPSECFDVVKISLEYFPSGETEIDSWPWYEKVNVRFTVYTEYKGKNILMLN